MKIAPCLGCDGCKRGEKICVQKDDSQLLMNEMRQADYIVFATPVYWWGMTAQLKLPSTVCMPIPVSSKANPSV